MEVTSIFDMLVKLYQTTWWYNLEDSHFQISLYKSLEEPSYAKLHYLQSEDISEE
jgi:hypothetical protein